MSKDANKRGVGGQQGLLFTLERKMYDAMWKIWNFPPKVYVTKVWESRAMRYIAMLLIPCAPSRNLIMRASIPVARNRRIASIYSNVSLYVRYLTRLPEWALSIHHFLIYMLKTQIEKAQIEQNVLAKKFDREKRKACAFPHKILNRTTSRFTWFRYHEKIQSIGRVFIDLSTPSLF